VSSPRIEPESFTIGELSRRTGLAVETIRYYERIGLVPRPPRTAGGHRSYGAEGCRPLAFVKRARELDFSIDEIRELLTLWRSNGTCMDVRSIALRRLEEVRARLRDLAELESVLTDAVARCPNDDSQLCPVLAKLDDSCCGPDVRR
jgi:MerR family mercuric resistance operon transcriptional regulator